MPTDLEMCVLEYFTAIARSEPSESAKLGEHAVGRSTASVMASSPRNQLLGA
jgi:hypothetical protein